MNITVTADDIKYGRKGDPCYCPIALAIRRATPIRSVKVLPSGVFLDGKRYLHTDESGEFQKTFDRGMPVVPFSFTLVSVFNNIS